MEQHVILYRRVPCQGGYVDTEVFVELRDGVLSFPRTLPDRFEGRVTATDLTFVLHTKSSPFQSPTIVSQAILASQGIWITEDDTLSRGGVEPRVFGIPLDANVLSAWLVLPEEPSKHGSWRVRVGYHGTDGAHMQSIQRENVLRPSLGQLGLGVYTGSFWKACRFAVRDQDYHFRNDPCVLRVLWLCDESKHLSFPTQTPCTCTQWCAKKTAEEARACAHELDWSTEVRWQSASLFPSQMSNGRWITHNEEWVCSPRAVERLQQIAFVNCESVDKPHYNPLQRSIQIL